MDFPRIYGQFRAAVQREIADTKRVPDHLAPQ